mgnify:CR=1 FL=1|tara:strand:+ start:6498 stop:7697 length:1200 start_codon:yes stop_codon:yes gene_type:complete
MPIYNDVFGGANIYPSEISYSSVALSADIVLSWPTETSTNVNLATRIMDVVASSAGLSITMPDASKTGTGNTVLFNNQGAQTFVVKNAAGAQIVSIASGTVWQVYLTNNSTVAGTWESLQFGATVSEANASALAGTGIVAVGTLLSQSVPITAFNSNYTAGAADRAKMFNWTGAGGTLTLPSPTAVGDNWFLYLRNSGSGAVVADAPGVTLIDGSAALSFQPGESAIIACDGVNFYTIGFGKSAVFAFDYTVIAVGGTGNYTLTGTELNRVSYRFTGVLTGNRAIIVPATVQQYWVDNQTTGAYTFTVKTPAGLGVILATGERAILYSDGTDVLRADTSGVSYPIAVNQGGTGATSAGSALINLGGTSVGTGLFTAVDQAAAWGVLGLAQSGNVNGGSF